MSERGPESRERDRHRRLEREAYDAIVIGAGVGGLTAAALLARRGAAVLVLDQHYVAGGQCTMFRRRQYEFDVGLHSIGACSPEFEIPRILAAAGVSDLSLLPLDRDGYDTYVFPDFTFREPVGVDRFHKRLVELFPAEAAGIERFVRFMCQSVTLLPLVIDPLDVFPNFLRMVRAPLALRYARATLREFVATCTTDPRLTGLLCGNGVIYCGPASTVSAIAGAGARMHFMGGAYYVKGGGHALTSRLAQEVEAAGGKILLLSRVSRILVEKGRVMGVEFHSKHLGLRRVSATVVISSADYKHTLLELVEQPHLSARRRRRAAGLEVPPGYGVLYLGLRRDLVREGYRNTNYHVHSTYDPEGHFQAVREGRLADTPFAWITSVSLKDPENPRSAPPGHSNLQVISVVPSEPAAWGVTEEQRQNRTYSRNERYKAMKKAFAEQMLDLTERLIPGLRKDVTYLEVSTPLSHARFTSATLGTPCGLAYSPQQFPLRPGAGSPIAGLYLCGQCVRPIHGVYGGVVSGMVAASKVIGKDLLRELYRPPLHFDQKRGR
jgi:phytoene dehydrogenase-like protein